MLLVLLHVVKELSTARLRTSQKVLQESAPSIVNVLFAIYHDRASSWLSGSRDRDSMELSLLALRTLRRLLISGFEHLNRDESFTAKWALFRDHLSQMLNMNASDPIFTSLLQDHLMQLAKFHLKLSVDRATAFALLPHSIDLVHTYWTNCQNYSQTIATTNIDDDDDPPFPERFSLKALLLLRACSRMVFQPLHTFRFPRDEDKVERNEAKMRMKERLLTPEFCRHVMTVLVTRLFVFTPRDLRQWEETPDEWELDQDANGEDWEYSVRTCSEKLFLDIIIHYKIELVPTLVEIIQSAGSAASNDLLKDSIYAAIGLAAPVLDNLLDFSSLLETTFASEAAGKSNLLRRRIAIVLGQWLPVKEGLNRPLVYQIFQHLLNKDDHINDEVVQMTAARQLPNIIDPFDFNPVEFVPFAPSILQSLLLLLQETSLAETRIAILITLHSVVTKLEEHVGPLGDPILQALGSLWSEAGNEYLLKQHILNILRALVVAMERESQRYHAIIIPLVQSSTRPGSDDLLHLQEEALDLWAAILEQTETCPPELLQLLDHLIPLYDIASDTLRVALEITETYVHLAPTIMVENAVHFLTPLKPLIEPTPARKLDHAIVGQIRSLLDVLLRTSGATIQSMTSTGIFAVVIQALHDAYQAHQTTGPNRTPAAVDSVVETEFFALLARLAIVDVRAFLALSADWLLAEWFAEMDNFGTPTTKKLATLALTKILSTGEPAILQRLQSLMSLWTDLLSDLLEETPDPPAYEGGSMTRRDCLVYSRERLLAETDSPATSRSKNLVLNDPVHSVDMRDEIREKLGQVVAQQGGWETFRGRWIDGVVDADVLGAFEALGL